MRKLILSLALAAFIILLSTAFSAASESDSISITVRPLSRPPSPGASIPLSIDITSNRPLADASLHVRPTGAGVFTRVQMSPVEASAYTATIPKELTYASLEYYVEATNDGGLTAFFPGPAASRTLAIPIAWELSPPVVETFSPRPGESLQGEAEGMSDNAGNELASPLQWRYRVPDDGEYGGSRLSPPPDLRIDGFRLDIAPAAQSNYSSQPGSAMPLAMSYNLDGRFGNEGAIDGSINFSNTAASGYPGEGAGAPRDRYSSTLRSLNIDNYHVSFRQDNHELSIGNRFSNIPYQIMADTSYSGLSYHYSSPDSSTKYSFFFEPDHRPRYAFLSGPVYARVSEQSRLGARLSHMSKAGNEMNISLLHTEDRGQGLGGAPTRMSGTVIALDGKIYLQKSSDLKLRYLVAKSFENYGSLAASAQNSAVSLALDGYLGRKLYVSAGYRYVEPSFALLSSYGQDRRELDVRTAWYLSNYANVGFNFSSGSDNVLLTKSRTTFNRTIGYSLNLTIPRGPSFSFSANRMKIHDDAAQSFMDMETDSISVSGFHATPRLTASAFWSNSATRNQANEAMSYTNSNMNLDLTYNLTPRLAVRGGYGRSLNSYLGTGMRLEGQSSTVGLIYTFKPGTLSGGLLHTTSSMRDNMLTLDNLDDTWSIVWEWQPRRKGIPMGSKLVFGADVSRCSDFLTPANSFSTTTFRASYNLIF